MSISTLHILRCYVEMVIATSLGRLLLAIPAEGALRLIGISPSGVRAHDPAIALVAMVAAMIAPMIGWMRYRSHSWRSCLELTASMLIPTSAVIARMWASIVTGFGTLTLIIGAPGCQPPPANSRLARQRRHRSPDRAPSLDAQLLTLVIRCHKAGTCLGFPRLRGRAGWGRPERRHDIFQVKLVGRLQDRRATGNREQRCRRPRSIAATSLHQPLPRWVSRPGGEYFFQLSLSGPPKRRGPTAPLNIRGVIGSFRARRDDAGRGCCGALWRRCSRPTICHGPTGDDSRASAAVGYEMRMNRPSDGMPSAVTANSM